MPAKRQKDNGAGNKKWAIFVQENVHEPSPGVINRK
jgi:hypothetical protein